MCLTQKKRRKKNICYTTETAIDFILVVVIWVCLFWNFFLIGKQLGYPHLNVLDGIIFRLKLMLSVKKLSDGMWSGFWISCPSGTR